MLTECRVPATFILFFDDGDILVIEDITIAVALAGPISIRKYPVTDNAPYQVFR